MPSHPESATSAAARELLTAFDALPDAKRDTVLMELLLRCPIGEGDLPDADFEELADELFRFYDHSEAVG